MKKFTIFGHEIRVIIRVEIEKDESPRCPDCGRRLVKAAYHTGDGWQLFWACDDESGRDGDCVWTCDGDDYYFIDWDQDWGSWMTGQELKDQGFVII